MEEGEWVRETGHRCMDPLVEKRGKRIQERRAEE